VAFHRILRVVFLSLLCSPSFAQNPTPVNPGDMNPPVTDSDEVRARMAHDMEKKAAKDRVAALKNDTEKLLKLSVELKSYVDKSDENVLSLTVIKKAEEIEKLAKSVKDKMNGPN
jgi:5'-deoxynucleotidase YfbR-like HD superfamily hydrolase